MEKWNILFSADVKNKNKHEVRLQRLSIKILNAINAGSIQQQDYIQILKNNAWPNLKSWPDLK